MFRFKKLILALSSLITMVLLIMLIAPKGAHKAKEEYSPKTNSAEETKPKFVFVDEDLPAGYVAVLGYEDVYQIIIDGRSLGYKIKLINGSYEDYDINKPSNYVIFNEEKQIYSALSSSGSLLYYRHFNGNEWDIVSDTGEIILAVPDNYERCDNSQELYRESTEEGTYIKRISKFADGTFAWSVVESPVTTTVVTTVITTTTTVTTETNTETEEKNDSTDEKADNESTE